MDDQSRDQIVALAAKAGMVLEDVTVKLILLPGERSDQIQSIIEGASSELEHAIELLRSAQALAT